MFISFLMIVKKLVKFNRKEEKPFIFWTFGVEWACEKKSRAAALRICQEFLYILCEFVEYSFETLGSKRRRLSNKMYKYS